MKRLYRLFLVILLFVLVFWHYPSIVSAKEDATTCPSNYKTNVLYAGICLVENSRFCQIATGSGKTKTALDQHYCENDNNNCCVDPNAQTCGEYPDGQSVGDWVKVWGCARNDHPIVPSLGSPVEPCNRTIEEIIAKGVSFAESCAGDFCDSLSKCYYDKYCYSKGELLESNVCFTGTGTDSDKDTVLRYGDGECVTVTDGSDGWDECISSKPPSNGNGEQKEPEPMTCGQVCANEGDMMGACEECICPGGNTGSIEQTNRVWTELGCISASSNGVILAVMRIFLGIVTGAVILRFIQAGFMMNTDDPEKIKEAKSIVVSAITALIFGAMIAIILNFIGINILDIGDIV